MKKTLEIELEEECLECPELSLETSKLSIGSSVYNLHRCERLEFCQNVRKAWEAVQARKMVCCEERKWWNVKPCYDGCSRWSAGPYEYPSTNGDGFCSYGERRQSEEATK